MPNKSNVPLLNIIDRVVPRRGAGCGEWRCRYYCNTDKKVKYIAYQYGGQFNSEEAYDKVKTKRDKLLTILENEVTERKRIKAEKLLNKPPPQKRGRKPLPPELKKKKPIPRIKKLEVVRDPEGSILEATISVER
jgi:hypothetical protein